MKQVITKNFLLFVLLLAVVFAFAIKATIFQADPTKAAAPPAPATSWGAQGDAYWFSGKAELNTYQLQQAINGSLSKGEALLIFQTENFLTDKQVKADSGDKAIPVLKTSLLRDFGTGLYTYKLATSVFTPISNPLFPNTLKVSTSVQEWDGNSYLQLNYRDNAYQISSQSFLKRDASEQYTLNKVILEDELWNRIRLQPDKLPTGSLHLISGTQEARLRHEPLTVLAANATLADYEGVLYPGQYLKAYTIEYDTDDRTLAIIFEREFPHRIVGWEETYQTQNNLLTSRAVLKKTIQSDYWNHKTPADSTLRQALNL